MGVPCAKLVCGNTVIYPKSLREFLKKSHYWLSYDPEKETATLHANHGGGGVVLLELRQASYENAARLAEELGLEKNGDYSWSKWNPVVRLYHDGSAAAETVRLHLLDSGLPFVQINNSLKMAFSDGDRSYGMPSWSLEAIMGIISDLAERHAALLASTP